MVMSIALGLVATMCILSYGIGRRDGKKLPEKHLDFLQKEMGVSLMQAYENKFRRENPDIITEWDAEAAKESEATT